MQAKNTKSLKLTVDYFDVHDDAGLLTTNPERGKVRRGGLPIFPLTTPSPSLQSVSPSCPYMGKMGPTPAMPAQQFGGSPLLRPSVQNAKGILTSAGERERKENRQFFLDTPPSFAIPFRFSPLGRLRFVGQHRRRRRLGHGAVMRLIRHR